MKRSHSGVVALLAVCIAVLGATGVVAAGVMPTARSRDAEPARTSRTVPPPVAESARPAAARGDAAPVVADPAPRPTGAVASAPASTVMAEAPAVATPGASRFTITVAPACARPGDHVVARIVAVPGAQVSVVVAYADGSNHGEMFAGPVDAAGRLEFPWRIPAAAPSGTGHVYMAGHDPASNQSISQVASFDVAGGCS